MGEGEGAGGDVLVVSVTAGLVSAVVGAGVVVETDVVEIGSSGRPESGMPKSC